MQIQDKTIVITGGAAGIGRSLGRACIEAGAAHVVLADRNGEGAMAAAAELGPAARGTACDVSSEEDVQSLVSETLHIEGSVDIFVSNAGVTAKGGLDCSNEQWQQIWDINVMSRVYAARAVIPGMLERGSGCIVQTASAAGLLTEIGSAPYSVTKHADLAFAEWLSVHYGRQGIEVSCVCPLGVETDMLDEEDPVHKFLYLQSITADEAANSIIRGIEAADFLILPHPDVLEFFQRKAADYSGWLRGMQRLQQKFGAATTAGRNASQDIPITPSPN